jgi:hypothetical protein
MCLDLFLICVFLCSSYYPYAHQYITISRPPAVAVRRPVVGESSKQLLFFA